MTMVEPYTETEPPLEPWQEEMLAMTSGNYPDEPAPNPVLEAEKRLTGRFDRNFVIIESALVDLRAQMAQVRRRPPRPRRTGSAARFNPDSFHFGMVIVAITAFFAVAALTASFSGQFAMAQYTSLPAWLWWVVPAAIDLPIMSSSFTAAIFRRRKQRVWTSWLLVGVLTVVSTVINIVHVLKEAGVTDGAPLTIETLIGATVMGIMPILVLVLFESLAKLLVKPTGEAREPVSAVAVRTPQRKKK